MSECYIQCGIVGELGERVDYEQVSEALREFDSDFELNYEGTLLAHWYTTESEYDLELINVMPYYGAFVEFATRLGIDVVQEKTFLQKRNTAVDSPFSLLTVEQYNNM